MRTVITAADLLTSWYVCAEPRVTISKHAQLTSMDNETLKPNLTPFLMKQKQTVFDKPCTNMRVIKKTASLNHCKHKLMKAFLILLEHVGLCFVL